MSDKNFTLKIIPSTTDVAIDASKIMVERETNQIISGHHRALAMQATLGGVPESCIKWV